MRAVVMAGGEGSRLRPLTIGRPKPMVPIVDKPCIGHIFDLLRRHGITDAFVTLQYMASVIQDAYGDGGSVGMRLRYSVEETPLGTGGSVRQLGKALDAPFLVISGDALTDIDLARVIAFHEEKKAAVTLTLVHVPDPLEYGVVITDGEKGSYAHDGEEFLFCGTTGTPVIERTGAGDAFAAGLTVALAEGGDLVAAVRFGNAVASFCVEGRGTDGLATRQEIDRRLGH